MHTVSRRSKLLPVAALMACLFGLACGAEPEAVEAPEPPAPSFGSTDARLRAMLETTVARWNDAACLGIGISEQPNHRLVFNDGSKMTEGRMAQTVGSRQSATIRIMDDEVQPWHYTPEFLEALVMHEMAHVLAFTDDHAADGALGPGKGDNTISDATLTRVCSSADPGVVCGCFNVEQ